MTERKKLRVLWICTAVFLAIMSLTFLAMPYAAGWYGEEDEMAAIIVSSVFWGAMLLGLVFAIISLIYRKKHFKEESGEIRKVFIPFMNGPAKIADSIIIFSALCIMTLLYDGKTEGYFTFVAVSMLVFSINMHFLVSGKVYKIISITEEKGYDEESKE